MTDTQSIYADVKPDPFFEVRVHEPSSDPGTLGLVGLCANYEAGRWRAAEFAEFVFDYLAEFALDYSEIEGFNAGTGRRQLRKAASLLYSSAKYKRRGEFGELILHAVCREIYSSEPAISKIFFKGSLNETVHGFDSVHVAGGAGGLELLLGEVKFYGDARSALLAVWKELHAHLEADYLRTECMLITNKLDDRWPYADELRRLVSERETLDRIFRALRVPVVVTYDSPCVRRHACEDPPYPQAFEEELRSLAARFADRGLPAKVIVDLVLVPLGDKATLRDALHSKLEHLQAL